LAPGIPTCSSARIIVGIATGVATGICIGIAAGTTAVEKESGKLEKQQQLFQ